VTDTSGGQLKLFRLAIVVTAAGLALAACGGSGSSYVAKVGSKPITNAQLQAVLDLGRKQYRASDIPFPKPGTAEYLLLRQQALDFLVQQTLAHQADAKLGIKPEDRVVTHASWLKVTGKIRVSDAEVRAVFAKNPKRYKPGPNRTLDLGTATEIRTELLRKERDAAMHRFVTDAEKRWPVTYPTGNRPVSEMALARKVWTAGPQKSCNLPPGNYSYAEARAHGCLADEVPVPGRGSPACSLIGVSAGPNGFTGAEENDGYADYLENNAGTCNPDPRTQPVQVRPEQSTTTIPPAPPVKVSYLHAAGTATFRDPLIGLTLRYPRRLHVQQVAYGSVISFEGVVVANYPIDPSAGPPNRPLSAHAVDLFFTQSAGPFPLAKLPIRITDADLAPGEYTTHVSAEGLTFTLTIRTGGSPSRQDVEALKTIAASIHFPPLRVGHFAGLNRYVLGRVSSYPLGSVTEVPANAKLKSGRFYLEHTADGFWTITWPDNYLHGYKACGPHFDSKQHRFTCPSGAVWDVKGRVVKNPDPEKHPDDPLQRTEAGVADGYVLVSLPSQP